MMKLFRSGFRRYTKNIVFWICLCVSVIVGLLIGINIKDSGYIDDTYIIAEFFIFPILVSLLLGREYSDGAFRNKIVTGHSKGKAGPKEPLTIKNQFRKSKQKREKNGRKD